MLTIEIISLIYPFDDFANLLFSLLRLAQGRSLSLRYRAYIYRKSKRENGFLNPASTDFIRGAALLASVMSSVKRGMEKRGMMHAQTIRLRRGSCVQKACDLIGHRHKHILNISLQSSQGRRLYTQVCEL
jgi:hypothetical protein